MVAPECVDDKSPLKRLSVHAPIAGRHVDQTQKKPLFREAHCDQRLPIDRGEAISLFDNYGNTSTPASTPFSPMS